MQNPKSLFNAQPVYVGVLFRHAPIWQIKRRILEHWHNINVHKRVLRCIVL